jgi:hypothetical protein
VEVDSIEVIEQLRRECSEASYALAADGSTHEAARWYEHEADLRAFSRQYPHLLFTLRGEGQDNTDIWALYVVNGKSHKARAQIMIPPFDASELV